MNLQNIPTILIPKDEVIEQGRSLCYLENAGWGRIIKKCIKEDAVVPEDIINAAYHLITKQWAPNPLPEWITYIPSHRRKRVLTDFSKRLAAKLQVPVYDIIEIANQNKEPIHHYNNNQQKVENSIDNWILRSLTKRAPVLLIDDFAFSRWTLTIIGRLLKIAGVNKVYPFTLGYCKGTK